MPKCVANPVLALKHQSLSLPCVIFYGNIKDKFLPKERNSFAFNTSENLNYNEYDLTRILMITYILFYKDKIGQIKEHSVLVLAGTGLYFFIVACMWLCFGFVLKIVLITCWCFSYC